MYKTLNSYIDIANSIKPDIQPETYDKDFGGSINEPISAGLGDFATASRQMNFRFKALNEDVSKPTLNTDGIEADVEDETDYSPNDAIDFDNEDDFGKFLRGFDAYGKGDDVETEESPKGVKLTMDDYSDIDWNQTPDILNKQLGDRTRELLNIRTIENNKNTEQTQKPTNTKSTPESIHNTVHDAARDIITILVKNGIVDQYKSGLNNDSEFISNKIIEETYNEFSDRPSLRSKVEQLLLRELKSHNGDISDIAKIYYKKH